MVIPYIDDQLSQEIRVKAGIGSLFNRRGFHIDDFGTRAAGPAESAKSLMIGLPILGQTLAAR